MWLLITAGCAMRSVLQPALHLGILLERLLLRRQSDAVRRQQHADLGRPELRPAGGAAGAKPTLTMLDDSCLHAPKKACVKAKADCVVDGDRSRAFMSLCV